VRIKFVVRVFPPFHGAERRIHVFIRDRQLNSFWGKSIHATVLLVIYIRSVLILSFLLLLCRKRWFAIKFLYASVFLLFLLHALLSSSSFTYLYNINYKGDAGWASEFVRVFWEKKNIFPLPGCNDENDSIGNNNVFEMLLYCLCVYVVHFKMFLQISVCWSANLPPCSVRTVSKQVAAHTEVFAETAWVSKTTWGVARGRYAFSAL
jgi:hypothetical protein